MTEMQSPVFLDTWQEKIFLGQEFLTWLWVQAELSSSYFELPALGAVELWFESRLVLESGQGQDKRSVTCQTPEADWPEARTALKEGKKLALGRVKVRLEEKEWAFTLKADTLTPQAVKLPKTFTEGEEEEDSLPGRFMERAALMAELLTVLDKLYQRFLEIRLSEEWDISAKPQIRKWLESRAG